MGTHRVRCRPSDEEHLETNVRALRDLRDHRAVPSYTDLIPREDRRARERNRRENRNRKTLGEHRTRLSRCALDKPL